MTTQYGMMGDVLGQCGLAHPIGSDQDQVRGILQKGETHPALYDLLVALSRPVPVKIRQGFEAAHMGTLDTSFQGTPGSLLFFPVKQQWQPRLVMDLFPVFQEAVKFECNSTCFEFLRI